MIELAAVIDVGSHALKMRIFEINSKGDTKELEYVRKIIGIGHDTFTMNKITFETVDKVCDTLTQFKSLMNDYNVTNYYAVATSAVREAENKAYLLDQIKLKTGLDVQVIDNSKEQCFIHLALKHNLKNYKDIIQEGVVFITIGAGSIQITVYNKGNLLTSQNIKLGILRITDILSSLERDTLTYHKILELFIRINMESLECFEYLNKIKHYIAVGGEISLIYELIIEKANKQKISSIEKDVFDEFYEKIIHLPRASLISEYYIHSERAVLILPSVILFKIFLDSVNTQKIIIPKVTLIDGIILNFDQNIINKKNNQLIKTMHDDIITSVIRLGNKYHFNEKHSLDVCNKSMKLFNALINVHGLSDERLLLRIAAILHDIGKFINIDKHYEHSFYIIKSSEIIGLSNKELEIIAYITKYHESLAPKIENNDLINEREQLIIAKLTAILRVCDALDSSHLQKIMITKIEIKDKYLYIYGETRQDVLLEKWSFQRKSYFFKEVFGLTPVLKITNTSFV